MTEIQNTIQEILLEESNAEKIIENAQTKANSLKQSVEYEIEKETKSLIETAKKEASEILSNAKMLSEKKAENLINEGIKQAETIKKEAKANISEVGDYIIHKLKVVYGNR